MKKVIEELTQALEILDCMDASSGRLSTVKELLENCIDELRGVKEKKNKIVCDECFYGIEVDTSGLLMLCDNPNLKSFGKNIKHGRSYSCGYGVDWKEANNG